MRTQIKKVAITPNFKEFFESIADNENLIKAAIKRKTKQQVQSFLEIYYQYALKIRFLNENSEMHIVDLMFNEVYSESVIDDMLEKIFKVNLKHLTSDEKNDWIITAITQTTAIIIELDNNLTLISFYSFACRNTEVVESVLLDENKKIIAGKLHRIPVVLLEKALE